MAAKKQFRQLTKNQMRGGMDPKDERLRIPEHEYRQIRLVRCAECGDVGYIVNGEFESLTAVVS